jgi:hypothetical protein
MASRFRLAFALLALATVVSAEPAQAGVTPQLGRTAVVNEVSGTVLYKDLGERRFSNLPRSRTVVQIGVVINATRGRVRIRTAAGRGLPLNVGVFSQGTFILTQPFGGGGLTELRLIGGRLRCGRGARASGSVQRRIRGDARGRFKTRGRFSAATVRGTKWVMDERCDGTRTASQQGAVETTDSGGDISFDLDTGDVAQYFCDFDGLDPISGAFCTVVLNRPAQGLWGAGIVNLGTAPTYDLCLGDPTGEVRCGTFPFSPPDADGLEQSAVVCTTDRGPGPYTLRWFINGLQLGPQLEFTGTQPPQEMLCISDPPTGP